MYMLDYVCTQICIDIVDTSNPVQIFASVLQYLDA